MQLGELYTFVRSQLSNANIPEVDSEARVILREVVAADMAQIMGHPEKEIPEDQIDIIKKIINRRLMREPLQYILGKWNFMGLDLCVGEGVLIPRPDTEVLVETALDNLHDGMRILDLCTGTGCILISLLKYSNDCVGTGVDISEQALALAKKNAELTQVDANFVLADLYEGASGQYDIIVSNPPYIATAVIDTLEPEVRDYEPHLALDGGEDGLDLVRRIIDEADLHLFPGGKLMLEIGYDQGPKTCSLMEQSGLIDVHCIKDYAGLDRVVVGTKSILRAGGRNL